MTPSVQLVPLLFEACPRTGAAAKDSICCGRQACTRRTKSYKAFVKHEVLAVLCTLFYTSQGQVTWFENSFSNSGRHAAREAQNVACWETSSGGRVPDH